MTPSPSNPHAWHLTDLDHVVHNGLKVMSTFACGGGSSLGYKLAGFEVIAGNDIDPQMSWHYQTNLSPKYYFQCPIGDLVKRDDLPRELYDLDVLDGSPPCSTFSTAGKREEGWGKLKHFREGQAKQILSDLFFDYIDLVDKLRPKIAIAENVRGMLLGNAKGYTKMIVDRLRKIGYRPQVFLINSADCGVPQARERVFFCAVRDDIEVPKLQLNPSLPWVTTLDATSDLQELTLEESAKTAPSSHAQRLWSLCKPGHNFGNVHVALGEKNTDFSRYRLHPKRPAPTLTAQCGVDLHHWAECRKLTVRELIRLSSFPDDYNFRTSTIASYLLGMSVPPFMMKYVAEQVAMQWLQGNQSGRTKTEAHSAKAA